MIGLVVRIQQSLMVFLLEAGPEVTDSLSIDHLKGRKLLTTELIGAD